MGRFLGTRLIFCQDLVQFKMRSLVTFRMVFKIIWRHAFAMIVNMAHIVKSFCILKNEMVGMIVIKYLKTIQLFSFDKGLKNFYADIIIGIAFM